VSVTLETAIRLVRDNTIATVTLNRPEAHNALEIRMIHELTSMFEACSLDEDIRAVVLCAEGASFCAGADLNWMKDSIGLSFEENKIEAARLAKLFQSIRNCAKPVIAKVQGPVYGGGLGLIAACDLSVAHSDALFCFSEVKLGLVPAVISPYILEKVPYNKALRYMMTAEKFTADVAQQIGLISEVAEDNTALDITLERWLKAFLTNGPEAVRETKRLLQDGSESVRRGAIHGGCHCASPRESRSPNPTHSLSVTLIPAEKLFLN
jgi:methylglutaconyl-CoA hydratase